MCYMELQYRLGDLAEELGLKETTVRKYFKMIEKRGYYFHRDPVGYLVFSQDDVNLFKEIIKKKNHPDNTLEEAIAAIVNVENDSFEKSNNEQHGLVPYEQFESMREEINELKNFIYEQQLASEKRENMLLEKMESIQEQLSKQEEQKYLEEDNNTKVENEVEETEDDEVEHEAKTSEKKSFWVRLFGG